MSRSPTQLWTAEADAVALKLGRLAIEERALLERLREIAEAKRALETDARALDLTRPLAEHLGKNG